MGFLCSPSCHLGIQSVSQKPFFVRLAIGNYSDIAYRFYPCMRLKLLFALFLALLVAQPLHAQCWDNAIENLDGNKVKAQFSNGANWFWDLVSSPAYEVPAGSGVHAAFASSLWIGGLDPQNELHMAASTYRQNGREWYTGPVRRPLAYQCPTTIETNTDVFLKGIKRLSNGKLLILTQTDIYIHDLSTNQTIARPLPATRLWMDAFELPDGRIFLFGDDDYPTKNPVLFMDTVNYQITGGPILNWYHEESSVSLMQDGTLLLAGVMGCEVFDPVTNLATAVPDMWLARQRHDAVTLPNGDVMAFGGGSGLGGTGLTLATQYYRDDGFTNFWYQGPSMSTGRQRAIATLMPDGKYFISGGNDFANGTDIYDPVTNTMTPGAPLPAATFFHSVIVLDSERVLIAAQSQTNPPFRLYQFNIHTGASEATNLQIARPRLLLLDSTSVLVATIDNRHLQKIDINTSVQDDDRWQYVWKVSRTQIDAFRADYQAGTVDFDQYSVIERWPAHGNEAAGEDRNLAPFVDVNMDGYYRPSTDGDYPCIVGDQALWWVFNDVGPHEETGGRNLGVQVEAMAYAFDCSRTACPDTNLDYTTFLHLEVSNHSDTAYHALRAGHYVDFDLGGYADDYLATDTLLQMAIAYNGDDVDQFYGAHPPAWGVTVLPNGKLDQMASNIYYRALFGSPIGQPNSTQDFYDYLHATYADGSHMVNNGSDGWSGTAPGPEIDWIYPETDQFCGGGSVGWSEGSAGNIPGDRSFLMATQSFDLQPGEQTQLDLSYVFARGSSNLQSGCDLRNSTATIRNWWQNQLDRACFNTVVSREEPVDRQGLKVYPNPSCIGYVQLDWDAILEENASVELLDLQGRILMREMIPVGDKQHRLRTSSLAAGMYLIRFIHGNEAQVQRLIVD